MNNVKFLYRFAALSIIILSVITAASCSAQKKPEPQSTKKQEEEKIPPEELDKLKDSIKGIEKALMAVYEESKKPMFIREEKIQKQASENGKKEEGSSEGSDSSSEGSNSSSEGSDSSSGEPDSQKSQKLSPEQLKLVLEQEKYKKYENIGKDVLNLHSAWNSYEAKAISDFAMQTTINDFEASLNNLTRTTEVQDAYQSLMEVNQLYKYLPDFYMLYEVKVPPDLDRLRFAAKKIQLLSDRQDYSTASDVLLYFENIWMTARPKLKSNNAEIVNKFEFAFADLKNSVIAKNDMIVKAKAEVLLKLIDDMEKNSK